MRQDVIFESDRNTMERPAHSSRRALSIAFVGFRKHVRVGCDDCVQLVFVECNPGQVLKYEIVRCYAPGLHGFPHSRMEASTTLNGESLGGAGAGVVFATFLVFACARPGRIRADRQAAATAERMACFIGALRLECQTQDELNLP